MNERHDPLNSTPDSSKDSTPADAAQITAPPVVVSRTYVSDHVLLMDVPDNALRMWLLLRAFIYEKDPASRSVRITDEELAKLMHRSVSAVRKIRKTAYECGLLAEGSCVQESYRAPNGRHQLRTVRRITVLHIDPPEGYSGPTNIYSELRRIRGISAAQTGRSKSDTQSHQGKSSKAPASPNGEQRSDQHKQNVSAGRTECHFLVEGRPKMVDPRPKMDDHHDDELPKPDPQVSLPSASYNQPTHARTAADDSGVGSWLVGDPSGEHPPKVKEGAGTPGARLLAGLKAADGSRVAAHGVRAHAPTIDAALEVMSEHEIVEHLTGGGIRTAGGIVSRIGSLAEQVEIMARQRAEAAAIRDCRLCDGEGFRYHPEGRHHGPTSERCNHQVNGSDSPSAQALPEAEESTSGATRENATETTLTVEQARLLIRQILARSKGKSAIRATENAAEPSSSPSEGHWTQAVTRAL